MMINIYKLIPLIIGCIAFIGCSPALDTSTSGTPTPKFRVTYNLNKKAGVTATVSNSPAPAILGIEKNTNLAKPAPDPELSGYTFGGWYTEATTTNTFDFNSPVTASTTLYAKWTALESFTVTFDVNKPATSTAAVQNIPELMNIDKGLKVTRPATDPTLTGYIFGNWHAGTGPTNIEAKAFDFATAIVANKKLFAKWLPPLTALNITRLDGATGTLSIPIESTNEITKLFSIKAVPDTAKIGTLTWTVAAKTGSSATATISENSLVTVKTTGGMTLTVKSGEGDSAITKSVDITISSTIPLQSLVLVRKDSKTEVVTVASGKTIDLSATYDVKPVPITAKVEDLTWSVMPKSGSPGRAYIIESVKLVGGEVGLVTVTAKSGTGSTEKTATIDVSVIN